MHDDAKVRALCAHVQVTYAMQGVVATKDALQLHDSLVEAAQEVRALRRHLHVACELGLDGVNAQPATDAAYREAKLRELRAHAAETECVAAAARLPEVP